MANDILSEFDPNELKAFKKDFVQMVKVAIEIDRCYAEGQSGLDTLIPKYERLIADFNRKYSGLRLKTKKVLEHFTLRIFVNEKSVKDFFANSASKISGIKSIGRTNFNQADIGNMERFAQVLDSVGDRIFVSYSDAELGSSTLAAVLDKKEAMVEILAEPLELSGEASASFRICAHYALKGEKNMQIDIYNEASTFGFYNLLDEIEKREWFDRYRSK